MPNLKDQWRRLRHKKRSGKMVHLPIELHLLIIEHVERREDRYSLLLVCRDFYFATEKALYREIHLKDGKESSHLQLFQTIISSERIANHIQSITLSSIPTYEVATQTFFPALSQALSVTHNLKKFFWLFDWAIFSPSWSTWRNQTLPLFSGCNLQLHTLVIHGLSNHIILDSAFLNRQTELAILDVYNCFQYSFPRNALPKLAALAVSCAQTAQHINRPTLRALHLTKSIPGLLTCLLASSTLLTSLRLYYPISFVEFSGILHAYPCLRFLRLDSIIRNNNFPNWTGRHRLEYIFTHIAHLFALEKLTLHFSHPLKLKGGITGIRDMTFNSLKNLQVITLGHDYPGIYVQLRRGAKRQEITEPFYQEWWDDRWLGPS